MHWFRKIFSYRTAKIPTEYTANLAQFENVIGYSFRDKALLIGSLKHRSALKQGGEDKNKSNERLEFLGDAILDFIIAEYFYHLFPAMLEGELTKLRSIIVSGSALVRAAQKIRLGEFIIMSSNEEKTGGRERASLLEDSFEALVGAIYLDSGFKSAQQFVENNLLANWRDVVQQREFVNYKSLLLEHAQSLQWSNPIYSLKEESGPEHAKRFVVEVLINGVVQGKGEGASKKAAEQKAASIAAERLGLLPKVDPDEK